MGRRGVPGVHQGSEGHQGSPSLRHWAPSWGEVMEWDTGLACHCAELRETRDLLMSCGNPSLVGRSFSGAGAKVFLICHLESCTRLLWCSVSFLWALDPKSRLWLSWVVDTNTSPQSRGAQGAWCWGECFCGGFVSGESVRLPWWGCRGGFTRAQSRGHNYWVLLRSSQCCVGINGQIRKRKWVGG